MEEEPLLINKTIKKIEIWFRATGTNVKSTPKTRMDTIKSRAIYIINLLWLNMDLSGAVVWFISGIANKKSFTELTYLPFLIIYPFDAFTMKYWPWVYLHQIWSEVVVIVGLGAADYLFYTFCSNISVQFQLLKYNIEHLIPDDGTCGRLPNIEEIRTEFVDLIKWHQDLISSVKLLETIYTRSTLLNFVSSSALICLTGFNVLAGSDFVYVMTFVSFLFLSALQIFFLCFFGDLLLNSSTKVSDAVYNCRWYLAGTSLGKDLLLVQIRSQTPCKLTAWDFSEVNLKSFMKILSTAWSYFALLQTMYGSSP
ncbi:hypothetical protein HW555_010907 [Spodoptera exigua]|uniref:Odorant receptor n=1 Tax=Spodoptera exigua TaxID=7107 RepID=A0A835L134_SPOEX|nr:hypothetical protein HW555_010907 [Spodoptera exigua]